eukprot:87097-Pyramimonas_sp.AAC.1
MALAQSKLMARYLGFTLCRLFQQQLWESQGRQNIGAGSVGCVRLLRLTWTTWAGVVASTVARRSITDCSVTSFL